MLKWERKLYIEYIIRLAGQVEKYMQIKRVEKFKEAWKFWIDGHAESLQNFQINGTISSKKEFPYKVFVTSPHLYTKMGDIMSS